MILRETEATIKATLWGTVIVAFVQGILGGVGFLVFGLPQPAFWGTVMIPAAVIPIVGSAIIWGPAAIYLLCTGHIAAGVGLIIWGGVVVSIIDNVLKPILVKGGAFHPQHLHPLLHPGGHHLLRDDRLHPGTPDPLLSAVAAAHLPEDHPGAARRGRPSPAAKARRTRRPLGARVLTVHGAILGGARTGYRVRPDQR